MTTEQIKVALRWLLLPIWLPFWILVASLCGLIVFGLWLLPDSGGPFGKYLRDSYVDDFLIYPAGALHLIGGQQ